MSAAYVVVLTAIQLAQYERHDGPDERDLADQIAPSVEAYAVGYWMGRASGLDEGWTREAKRHGWDPHGSERAAFKAGYERGVSDYSEYDYS